MSEIFTEDLLRFGPWQEFERNTARLLLHAGWIDPRIVGRSGDGGADVLATDNGGAICVFQCKFSTRSAPGLEAIDDVRRAGKVYGAEKLCVVTSHAPTKAFSLELSRLKGLGLPISHLGPEHLLTAAHQAPLYPPTRVEAL